MGIGFIMISPCFGNAPGPNPFRRVWNPELVRAFGSNSLEAKMGLAEYMIVTKASGWSVLHDGETPNDYATKEAAFEAAAAAASMAIREGHEVHISVPSRESGNKTLLGASDPSNDPS
jgi:hypothetical protein